MKILAKVLEYLSLKKYKAEKPEDYNLVFMNRMNQISIFVFLIAMIILVIKWLN
jgi:hypothetical protein